MDLSDKNFVPCEAGLGNRLYAFYTGYYLSHFLNLQDKTIYLWPISPYCNVGFKKLFCPSNNLKSWHTYKSPQEHKNAQDETPILIKRAYEWRDVRDNLTDEVKIKLGAGKGYPINAIWFMFYDSNLTNLDSLLSFEEVVRFSFNRIKLNETVTSLINSVDIPDKTIGIHVRGGTAKQGKLNKEDKREYVPLNRYIEVISEKLSNNPSLKFFISTEDMEDEIILKEKFPHNTIIIPNSFKNLNRTGYQHAMAELVCLSKCDSIMGMISSFNNVASLIGKNKLTHIKA